MSNFRSQLSTLACTLIVITTAASAAAPDDLAALRQRASELMRQQDWRAAVGAYREVLARQPDDAWSWYILGAILQGTGDLDEAVQAMEAALERGISAPGVAWYNLACMHARLGHLGEAFDYLGQAARGGLFSSEKLDSDPDLETLRGDPRFAELRRAADLANRPCEILDDYRQMDFLIGTWDVYLADGGPKAATSVFTKASQGCAIEESWSSTLGGGFESLTYLDSARDRWIHVMVGSAGGNVVYEGEWKDGVMSFAGDAVGRTGPPTRNRRSWTPLDDGRVRLVFETSTDGGATWTVGLRGVCVRRTAEAAARR